VEKVFQREQNLPFSRRMGNRVLLCYGERQVLLFNLQGLSILAKEKGGGGGGNLKCHYNAPHSNRYGARFPHKSEIFKLKLKEIKSKLAALQQLMAKPRSPTNNATILILQGQQSDR
jgi:hypothetical protein